MAIQFLNFERQLEVCLLSACMRPFLPQLPLPILLADLIVAVLGEQRAVEVEPVGINGHNSVRYSAILLLKPIYSLTNKLVNKSDLKIQIF